MLRSVLLMTAFITTLLHGTGILAWLGLHLVDQQYQWISNDELTYTNWDTHEPNGNNMVWLFKSIV